MKAQRKDVEKLIATRRVTNCGSSGESQRVKFEVKKGGGFTTRH